MSFYDQIWPYYPGPKMVILPGTKYGHITGTKYGHITYTELEMLLHEFLGFHNSIWT